MNAGGRPLLHERFPPLRATLPHLSLSSRPTPIRRLELGGGGAEIWLKDDAPFGDGGWGGNKVRKLEWLLPDVQRRRRRTILTVGGLGTNWGLATALYGREQGLRTVLALIDQPIDEHVRAQLARLERSGAVIHRTRTKARTIATVPALMLRHADGLHPPYFLPAGGSSPLGAVGYVEAGLEIASQVAAGELPEPSHVVTAVGSGGTAAGLAVGLRLAGLGTQVVGIVVNDTLKLDSATLVRLAGKTNALLRKRGADSPADLRPDLESVGGWIGPGYGHPTEESQRAIDLVRERDGLELDPVYTGKAMAALLSMNEAGSFGPGPVLFLHTDGPR